MLAPVLLAAGGAALFVSLFAVWTQPGEALVLFGGVERAGWSTGWQLWDWADVVFAAIAAGLAALAAVAARRRVPRVGLALAALLSVAAIATIIGHGFERETVLTPERRPAGVVVYEPAAGPWIAIAALAAALAGLALAWLRPRAPAETAA